MSLFEDVPGFSAVQFFGINSDCNYVRGTLKPDKAFLLPSTSDLLAEEGFADVYAGWNVNHFSVYFSVRVPFQKGGEGDFRREDSIELFIDTRDLKTKGVVSKFCHHFIFFPVQVQNFYGREMTRFRNEDMHPLCHPEDLQVTPHLTETGYTLAIEIPAGCLHGYDPLSFSRIGFTYRINRTGGKAQHFSVSSEEYVIEQHPSTWGTLTLKKD